MTGFAYSDLERPPLREADLRRALLMPGGLWTDVRVVGRTESTNADLAAAGRRGAAEGSIVLAEEQMAGKGRLGRVWQSPPRAGIALSVLLRPGAETVGLPPVDQDRFGWLPLLTGVALVQAVRRVAEVEATLKWPNDLMIDDRKCAGILAEIVVCPAEPPTVIIGVGLNTTLRVEELPHPLATSLALSGASCCDRAPLAVAFLRDLQAWYVKWRGCGGDADLCGLRRAYQESCGTLARGIRAMLPGERTLEGVAEEIDSEGRLIVRDARGGHTVLAAGDVVHVRPD